MVRLKADLSADKTLGWGNMVRANGSQNLGDGIHLIQMNTLAYLGYAFKILFPFSQQAQLTHVFLKVFIV